MPLRILALCKNASVLTFLIKLVCWILMRFVFHFSNNSGKKYVHLARDIYETILWSVGNAVTVTNLWFCLKQLLSSTEHICCAVCDLFSLSGWVCVCRRHPQMGTLRNEIYLQSLCVCQGRSRTWIKGNRGVTERMQGRDKCTNGTGFCY